ncbi:hypothetical protein [Natrononativus amylolyticus]|uniref:hypothetical protein n=1 Tax=Natrononativus amylolyticus TaxID=2963434 RepID=UPI0020CBD317|nr:hypothetical protein [Natrononativus amylolyticus]
MSSDEETEPDDQETLRSARFGNFRFGVTQFGHARILNRVHSGAEYGARVEPIEVALPPRAGAINVVYNIGWGAVERTYPATRDVDGTYRLEVEATATQYGVRVTPLVGRHAVAVDPLEVEFTIRTAEAAIEYDIEADVLDIEYAIDRAITAVYDLVDEAVDVEYRLRGEPASGEYGLQADRLAADYAVEGELLIGEILDTRVSTTIENLA